MALLTNKDLQQKGRIDVLLQKLINKTPFTMKDGKQYIFTRISATNTQARVITYDPSKRAEYVAIAAILSNASVRLSTVQLSSDKDKVIMPLSQVFKSEEFGGQKKGNRGDMAEALFACAVAAKFLSKDTTVSVEDLKKMVGFIDPNKTNQVIAFKSKNKGSTKIYDDVLLHINLTVANLKALTAPNSFAILRTLVASSLKYANAKSLSDFAKTLYTNNKHNKIDVMSIGTLDQKGTKVDIKVKIDGHDVKLISLKADNTKQFGQVGGSSYEKQLMLWDTMLKISPTEAKKKYLDAAATGDYVKAIGEVYKQVVKEFNMNMANTGSRQKQLMNLSNGIRMFATKKMDNVEMVQLTKKEAMVYNFSNLGTLLALEGNSLIAVYNPAGLPKIDILDKNKKQVLVSIRVKREKDYVRNYIEKGKLLTELAGKVFM